MDDRDEYRPKTPPAGVRAQTASPVEFIAEEATGRIEGDELLEMRRRRPTNQRVEHLEGRVDSVIMMVGGLTGEIKGLAGEVKGLAMVVGENRSRDHVTFTAKVDVDKAAAVADVDVAAKRETAEIETTKAARIATIEVRKQFALKAIAFLAAVGGILAAGFKLGQCGGG